MGDMGAAPTSLVDGSSHRGRGVKGFGFFFAAAARDVKDDDGDREQCQSATADHHGLEAFSEQFVAFDIGGDESACLGGALWVDLGVVGLDLVGDVVVKLIADVHEAVDAKGYHANGDDHQCHEETLHEIAAFHSCLPLIFGFATFLQKGSAKNLYLYNRLFKCARLYGGDYNNATFCTVKAQGTQPEQP